MDIQKKYAEIRYLEMEIAGTHSHEPEIEAKLRETETHLKNAAESFFIAMTVKPADAKEEEI